MMNQSPEEQRQRVLTEAYCVNEVNRLGQEAMDKGLISGYGHDPSNSNNPYMINQHRKEEYFDCEKAISRLQDIISS